MCNSVEKRTSFQKTTNNNDLDFKLRYLKNKKVLFGFNIGNGFTAMAEIFHRNKIHADIFIQNPLGFPSTFKLANPLWENPKFNKNHILIWHYRRIKYKRILAFLEMARSYFFNHLNYTYPGRVARKYDVVISTAGNHEYFHKHKHFILFEVGPLRSLLKQEKIFDRMIIKSYKEAQVVIITQPDMIPLLEHIGVKNPIFMPNSLDYTRYIPRSPRPQKNRKFTIFVASKQSWLVKGSHHLIYAFATVLEDFDMKLVITKWGKDFAKTKALIDKLKIQDNIEYVTLTKKKELIKRINNADIIADQFIVGIYGRVTIEAMACGKPVLVHINEKIHKKFYGEVPPVLNCQSIKSIELKLREIYLNKEKAAAVGKKAREWVKEKHNPQSVFNQYVHILYDTLNN